MSLRPSHMFALLATTGGAILYSRIADSVTVRKVGFAIPFLVVAVAVSAVLNATLESSIWDSLARPKTVLVMVTAVFIAIIAILGAIWFTPMLESSPH